MHKILVIDDDETLRRSLAVGLRKCGFEVFEAGNAADGINLAHIRLPDLILCDLNMEHADGSVALTRLREDAATNHIPFILMTGQLAEATGLQVGAFRADELLVKPFTFDSLLGTVGSCLKQEKESRQPATSTKGPIRLKGGKAQSRHVTSRAVSKHPQGNRPVEPSREQLEALSARLQSLLEKERTQIARAIHDDLTQSLTVLALELSLIESSLDNPTDELSPRQSRASVKKLSRLVNDVIQSAQRIMADLRPKVLDELGLVAALEWFTEQFQKRTGIRCELRVKGTDFILDANAATEIYRLIQEILSNVAQHADASFVGIRVEAGAGELHLEVKDDGKGITELQIVGPESLGLLAMRKRMEHLGGEFRIAGRPGKGTTVALHIPLKSSSSDH